MLLGVAFAKGFGVRFRRVVGGGLPVGNEGEGEGGGGVGTGKGTGESMRRRLSKLPFSKLPFRFCPIFFLIFLGKVASEIFQESP